MKKKYTEPQIIVEDFSMNETIANSSKCVFDVNNSFTSQMTWSVDACRKASEKANVPGTTEYEHYALLSDFYEGLGDFGNEDGDNIWVTNNAEVEPDSNIRCFTPEYASNNVGQCAEDGRKYMFMNYAQTGKNYNHFDACSSNAGVNPLQNS